MNKRPPPGQSLSIGVGRTPEQRADLFNLADVKSLKATIKTANQIHKNRHPSDFIRKWTHTVISEIEAEIVRRQEPNAVDAPDPHRLPAAEHQP